MALATARMELSQTCFDVDLDQYDTDLPWLKSRFVEDSIVSNVESSGHVVNLCDKSFKKQSQREERRFVCDICQRAFKEKHHLTRHRKIHTGEKEFVCKICQKAFVRSDHMIAHQRAHIGAYVWDICCDTFRRKDQLHRHQLTHAAM